MKADIYFLIGTNAEFIKLLPIIWEVERRNVPFKIISTGQNNVKSSELFEKINHKKIDIQFNTPPSRQTAPSLLFWWIKTFFAGYSKLSKINSNKKSIIIHGDTISTLLGAILGKMRGFKIIHIESGLRSFDLFNPFPEEIDRIIVSNFSDVHFAPGKWAMNNLKNKHGLKINTYNNTLIDSLKIALCEEDALQSNFPKKYFVAVLHRQENLMNKTFVKDVIDTIKKQSNKMHCVFVIHNNTKHVLKLNDTYDNLSKSKSISIQESVPYFKFMKILQNAQFLITDGGSNQEEAFYLGLPTFLMREKTERREGLGRNVILGGRSIKKMESFIKKFQAYRRKPVALKTSPSKIIADYLEKEE